MEKLSIVVPDGSMQETVLDLFSRAGFPVAIKSRRTKEGTVSVDWIGKVRLQRPQEIPHYLKGGHFDLGIVGEDWIANWGCDFPVLLRMPVGRKGNKAVRIALAVDQNSGIGNVKELPQGCEVATEYVKLAERFFSGLWRSDIRVIPSFGNTEHKIGFGVAAIIDVIESGESLRDNGLKIVCDIMESNTVLVANPESLNDESKRPYIDCFARLIKGAYQASLYVVLTANVPAGVTEEAAKIMGGLKRATHWPLNGCTYDEWFALQSVVPREDEHRIIFELLQIGVTDIVVNREASLIMT